MTIESKTEVPGKMRQVVRVDAHTLHADVGPTLGGEGSAPDPHDYFDTALATCKALTACVYARSRKMALDAVRIEVTRDSSQERSGHYGLHVTLAFEGGLSDDDKRKLADVLTRCPIHKLMTSTEIAITQSLQGVAPPR